MVKLSHQKLVQGPDADKWTVTTSKEFGRLAQGLEGVLPGTDTIIFIPHSSKPNNQKATYARMVADLNLVNQSLVLSK
jgi:hypothetical protein